MRLPDIHASPPGLKKVDGGFGPVENSVANGLANHHGLLLLVSYGGDGHSLAGSLALPFTLCELLRLVAVNLINHNERIL